MGRGFSTRRNRAVKFNFLTFSIILQLRSPDDFVTARTGRLAAAMAAPCPVVHGFAVVLESALIGAWLDEDRIVFDRDLDGLAFVYAPQCQRTRVGRNTQAETCARGGEHGETLQQLKPVVRRRRPAHLERWGYLIICYPNKDHSEATFKMAPKYW